MNCAPEKIMHKIPSLSRYNPEYEVEYIRYDIYQALLIELELTRKELIEAHRR